MPFDHHEFLQLCRIEDSLRRSDPELVRKLAAPIMCRRSRLRARLSYLALAVCALLSLVGLAYCDATVFIIGGLAIAASFSVIFMIISQRPRPGAQQPQQ
jgi:cyanate permease